MGFLKSQGSLEQGGRRVRARGHVRTDTQWSIWGRGSRTQVPPEAGKDGNRFSLELPEGASLLTHWELQNNHLCCVKPRSSWLGNTGNYNNRQCPRSVASIWGALPAMDFRPSLPQVTEVPSSKWAPSLGV